MLLLEPFPGLSVRKTVIANAVLQELTYNKAYGIFHITSGSLESWQYLFIIEGTATSFLALIAWIWMPLGPGSAWFLKPQEREYATHRIQADNALFIEHSYASSGLEKDRLTRRDVIEAFKDWKLWYVLVFNICASVPSQAFSVFLPIVVKGLGYSSLNANLVRSVMH